MSLEVVRSVFDSALIKLMVAPVTAPPLASVTVPCSDVEEVCPKRDPLELKINASSDTVQARMHFIGTSRLEPPLEPPGPPGIPRSRTRSAIQATNANEFD